MLDGDSPKRIRVADLHCLHNDQLGRALLHFVYQDLEEKEAEESQAHQRKLCALLFIFQLFVFGIH